ncbi:hypothetical protein [Lentzea sp. E54]|uniref:hypothetical protein n=1 Tax=Lentzea xerophila TaxID=3435883 RepID=UPI003DA1DC96
MGLELEPQPFREDAAERLGGGIDTDPSVLFDELSVTGRQESVDGRKIYSAGTISAGGSLAVSAEGLFVRPREESGR